MKNQQIPPLFPLFASLLHLTLKHFLFRHSFFWLSVALHLESLIYLVLIYPCLPKLEVFIASLGLHKDQYFHFIVLDYQSLFICFVLCVLVHLNHHFCFITWYFTEGLFFSGFRPPKFHLLIKILFLSNLFLIP